MDHQVTAHLPQVEVITGEAHQLVSPTGSFDAVHTDRVLRHLHDHGAVVNQLARLLRPGGAAVLAEPNRATLVVDHPHPTLVGANTRYVVSPRSAPLASRSGSRSSPSEQSSTA